MDGRLGIEHDRAVLQRIVVTLVAMAGLEPVERKEGRATLPRRLRNAVLKLLRPAESAARRLIIAASHHIAPEKLFFDKLRMRRSAQEARPASMVVRNGRGTGIVMTRAQGQDLAHAKPLSLSPEPVEGELAKGEPLEAELAEGAKARVSPPRLPLFDAMRRVQTRRWTRPTAVPRIMGQFGPDIHAVSVPPPPAPHDLLPAEPLRLRLDALAHALEDLPREALRFARWRARQALQRAEAEALRASPERVRGSSTDRLKKKLLANRGIAVRERRPFKERWPLRFGRPPGALGCAGHEFHAVLSHTDALARWALDQPVPDTS
ncbi:hypothetical protein NGM99_16550 [Mesorhizobium sp. RP14(2022)]|uniref:Transposase n=1 Tax=Mesorhizobium liriopis TaxID=2953882 RepID=A0ABT1CBQ9_9HYPH|nr:hypothetical protein [Mesorhizobium liriopis]MCO6051396.1 hypothetical protein [Mesorhizobium liriopis]